MGLTGRSLTPEGVVSPSFAAREAALQGAPEWFGWALFLWSVPFIWIALSMSVRRAASAGAWPWLGALVLLPGVNWLTMLVPLPGGRTRLEGRTWYTFHMHPQAYWTLWSDLSIHTIHRRVLAHVERLSEHR